ncbi:Xaa-Pro dipeptidyl-peptidase [Cytobacillus purgationiresistens]|uniref:X-Pro dipeptidyl-peptidase n=1 Tax=Cytobacillus purgationiresistens TaxID=863449 RepID=A0ABU0AHF8_9BACI|nr:Xaa-Pro dipeptidyl-peptidase [Cytobacillus purgationiresistens]MDQ0270495.1 X-Pro dipeptidyl-peptidase [Cytobacillus purgationiresistens]
MFKRKKVLSILLAMIMLITVDTTFAGSVQASDVLDVPGYQLENGVTEPIYSYDDAIKETIFVESSLDSDRDGNPDRIAADIIRPKETEEGLEVPVIMDASPYYESMGRGNESQIKDPDGDGVNEMFPLYYDNYFVPRGYAVVLVDMVGTNNSDGCPTTGGYEEIESAKVVIDWLNGKGKAWDKDGEEISADWSTGKVGMIGKSYDGTIAQGAAATGVEGLETIVPIGAISSWYYYYRYEGIPYYTNGPGNLARRVTSSERVEACAQVREDMRVASDDTTGDYNQFWDERNYYKDADNITASVLAIHGLNDYNVKANHFSKWWEAISEHDVPRKVWLTQTGHVDPFDFRRAEWVDTLHRWFDYWLLDIDNGIMDEPMADVQRGADEWETHASWPEEQAEDVKLRFAPETDELPGSVMTSPLLDDARQGFIDNPRQTEQQMVTGEFTQKDNRLLYMTPELEGDIRLSGVPELNIRASVDKDDTHLTALIVDYGTDTRINHTSSGEGVRTTNEVSCWGESSDVDSSCYKEAEITTHEAPYEIVTHGWLDAQNRESLELSQPLVPGQEYTFKWDTLPEDYVFKEGHRIGVIIAGSSTRLMTDQNRATFDVSLGDSYISLPIVGGKPALDGALGFNGGSSPETAKDMSDIVDYYKKDGEIKEVIAAKSLQMHLTSVALYEKQNAGAKVVKHLEGFYTLIDHQLDNDLITKEVYQVLKADTDYLISKWR